jgi:hypothetical protein
MTVSRVCYGNDGFPRVAPCAALMTFFMGLIRFLLLDLVVFWVKRRSCVRLLSCASESRWCRFSSSYYYFFISISISISFLFLFDQIEE